MFDVVRRFLGVFFSAQRSALATGCLGWVGGIFSAVLLTALTYAMPDIADMLRTPERVLALKAATQAVEVTTVTGDLSNTTSGLTKKLIDAGDSERSLAEAIANKIKTGDSIDLTGASNYVKAVSNYMETIKTTQAKANEIATKYHLDGLLEEGFNKYFQVLANSSQSTADCLAEIQTTYKPDPDKTYSDVRCEVRYGPNQRGRFYKLSDRLQLLDQCSYALRNYVDTTIQALQENSQAIAAAAKNRADNVELFSVDSVTRRFGSKDGAPDKPTAVRRDRSTVYSYCIDSRFAATYAKDSDALAGTYPPPALPPADAAAPKSQPVPAAPVTDAVAAKPQPTSSAAAPQAP